MRRRSAFRVQFEARGNQVIELEQQLTPQIGLVTWRKYRRRHNGSRCQGTTSPFLCSYAYADPAMAIEHSSIWILSAARHRGPRQTIRRRAFKVWDEGWKHNRRPNLQAMVEYLHKELLQDAFPTMKGFTRDLNSATHGDLPWFPLQILEEGLRRELLDPSLRGEAQPASVPDVRARDVQKTAVAFTGRTLRGPQPQASRPGRGVGEPVERSWVFRVAAQERHAEPVPQAYRPTKHGAGIRVSLRQRPGQLHRQLVDAAFEARQAIAMARPCPQLQPVLPEAGHRCCDGSRAWVDGAECLGRFVEAVWRRLCPL